MKTIILILFAIPAFGQEIQGTPSSGPGSGTVTSATITAGTGIAVSGTCTITSTGTCTVAESNPLTGVYSATSNGMICNDSTDDTTAFNALIATVNTAGGGTIWLPSICKITGAVVFPNTGGSAPKQSPIRITGPGGASQNGAWGALPNSKGGLDLTLNATVAKLDTRGQGTLEVDHIILMDSSNDCSPFIQTTNTTINIHDVTFSGSSAGPCQQAIRFGSTGAGGITTATAPFQGYNTVVRQNWFDKISTGGWWGQYANAIKFEDNTFSATCGGSGAVAIDITQAFSQDRGNVITGNLIEMSNYVAGYGVRCLTNCVGNYFAGNQTWDVVASAIASYDLTGSSGNILITSHDDAPTTGSWLQVKGAGITNAVIASVPVAGGTPDTGIALANLGALTVQSCTGCPGGGSVSNTYYSGGASGYGPTTFVPTHTMDVYDATAATGVTTLVLTKGANQGSTPMLDITGNNYETVHINATTNPSVNFQKAGVTFGYVGSGQISGGADTDMGIRASGAIQLAAGGANPVVVVTSSLVTLGRSGASTVLINYDGAGFALNSPSSSGPLISLQNNTVQFATFGSAGNALASGTAADFAIQTAAGGRIVLATGGTALANIRAYVPSGGGFVFGSLDAATAVAQTTGVQNVVAGTTNTAGANWSIRGSAGTGTGVGGSILFQTSPAGSTGTSQNSWTTALTIDSTQNVSFANSTFTLGGHTCSIVSTVLTCP